MLIKERTTSLTIARTFIARTFGGLSGDFYFDQLAIGLVFPGIALAVGMTGLLPIVASFVSPGSLLYGALDAMRLGYVATELAAGMRGLGQRILTTGAFAFMTASSLLYPYARFLYLRLAEVAFSDFVFLTTFSRLMTRKLFFMFLCWLGAIVLAPVSLLYLFFLNARDPC